MKRAKAPTASEQRWQDWLRAQGCAVCADTAAIHHCVGTGKQAYQDKAFIGQVFCLPLCYAHHQGPCSIHSAPLQMAQVSGLQGTTRKEVEKALFSQMVAHYKRQHDGELPFDGETIMAVENWTR